MIKFFIDREPRYIIGDKVYTQTEVDKMEHERQEKDRKAGYNDRMNGYYDKWYRYNRSDSGAAYDRGQQEASNNEKCAEDVEFIPCIH